MNSTDLKQQISEIDERLGSLQNQRRNLSTRLDKINSEEFIRVNHIKKSDVQRCDGAKIPWIGDIYKFGAWIKENSDNTAMN